jgi:hypothetical protein
VRETQRQVQLVALRLRAVANADQRQLALEALADALTMPATSARMVPLIALAAAVSSAGTKLIRPSPR